MDKNKIGTIFMISALALAGIGISYAGFTDTIYVFGTVSTGTVDVEIDSYSGTWAWKVYDAPNELVVTHDPTYSIPIEDGFLVSYAKGRPITTDDPEGYDAVVEFDNIFPCVDFTADILFHYKGSIPAKINLLEWDWEGDEVTKPDGTIIPDFITWLIDEGHMTSGLYRCDADGNLLDPLGEIKIGYQLHESYYFKLIVTIHLPQENWLQGLQGEGYLNIGMLQWTDQCGEEDESFNIEISKTASTLEPIYGTAFTYTVTATNYGPGDASNIIVTDELPTDVTYISNTTSKGTYDHNSGEWNIDSLLATESATLEITVQVLGEPQIENTQLALLIDGSGSITGTDWNTMLDGIALAITNGYIPHNGQVELTVIQFGGWTNERSWAQVELGGPIVLDDTNYATVASSITSISQLSGGTAMSCAFRLAADVLSGDPNDYLTGTPFEGMASTHSDWPRQVVNLITDGQPNIVYIHDERYAGSFPGNTPEQYPIGKADTEDALTYFLSLVPMAELDEIDAEAVGSDTDIDWLKNSIVRPQPGYDDWPPTGPGWVRYIEEYDQLADTLKEKFEIIFQQIDNCAELASPVDLDPRDNQACVSVIPQYEIS